MGGTAGVAGSSLLHRPHRAQAARQAEGGSVGRIKPGHPIVRRGRLLGGPEGGPSRKIGPSSAVLRRGGSMNRETHPKNPPNSVLAPRARSAALRWFVGSLLVFFLLIGVALVFWNV